MADSTDLISALQEKFGEEETSKKLQHLISMPSLWTALIQAETKDRILEADSLSLEAIEDSIRAARDENAAAAEALELIDAGKAITSSEDLLQYMSSNEASDGQLEVVASFAIEGAKDASLPMDLIKNTSGSLRRVVLRAYSTQRAFAPESEIIPPELPTSTIEALLKEAFFHSEPAIAELFINPDSAKTLAEQPSSMRAAIQKWAEGDLEQAQAGMEAAWDQATEHAAEVAEGIAQLAKENDQRLIKVEGYQRAYQMQPTPTRRATLALAKLDAGAVQEAKQLLTNGGESDAEFIALGAINISLGQLDRAKECFLAANPDNLPASPIWGQTLLSGWLELGEMTEALAAADRFVADYPVDPEMRRLAFQIFTRTNQNEKALDQAQALSLLQPSNQANQQLLAESLQAADRPSEALPIWIELSQERPELKVQAVQAALEADELNTALSFAQQLVESDPQSGSSRLALGKALIRAGNAQGGIVHIRRATELNPAEAEAWLELARIQRAEGLDDACGSTLSEACQVCPNSAPLLSEYASWLEAQGRQTEALDTIQMACELEPDDHQLSIQQAKMLRQMGRGEAAKPLLEKAVRQQPTNWPARIELASVYEQNSNYGKSLELLDGLPEHWQGSEAYSMLARAIIETSEDEDQAAAERAIAALNTAQQQGENDPSVEYWHARASQLKGEHEQALQQFQVAMKSIAAAGTELHQACLRGQAQSALASDQVPVAISLLERARQSADIEPASLALLSKAYMTAGLADEALSPAVEACQRDPSDPEIRQQYLIASKANGGSEQALNMLDEWIEEDPENLDLLYQKAELLADLSDMEGARNVLAELVWKKRREPAYLDHIAELLIDIDQPISATRLLINADYQAPNQTERLELLAHASIAASKHETAAETWQKILRLEPENIEALLGAAEANWQIDQRMSAIGYWQRALALEPERADLHARLARAQVANGETSQALDHFRSAAELAPENKSIRIEAAQALMANRSYTEALSLLNTGVKANTEPDPVELAMLAQIYLGLGRPQEALASIGRTSEESESAKLLALASLAHQDLGNSDQATTMLESALDLDPKSVDEATWVARASLTQGHWQAAINAADRAAEISEDSVQSIDLQLAVGCRVADAYTLLASFGSAVEHAPASTLTSESAFRKLNTMIEDIEAADRPRSEADAWRARLHAAFSREHPQGGHHLQSLPTDHIVRQQAIEGLALTQLENANAEGALRTLASAPESLQGGPWSPLIAGLAHLTLERPSMARKAFGSIEKSSPLWPLAAFLVGKCWQREARPDEAINSWNAAVLAWPDEIRWQSELALAYRQLEKPEAALPHLQTALEAAPDEHDLRLPLARSLFELGEISEAVKHYQLVRPQFEKDPEILTEIGQAMLAHGEPSEAYQHFQAALAIAPNHIGAEVGAAQAAWQLGDERLADKHTAKATRSNPREADHLIALTEIMLSADADQRALALLDESYGQSIPPAPVARLKAKALFKLGRSQEAVQLLRRVVEEDPEDDAAWAAMAKAYANANQAGQAIDALRMALNLRPGHKQYRLKLARLFRETGQLDQALDELTDLQKEDAGDHQIPLEIGLVHRARRQLQPALSSFEQSINLNENSASAFFQAGMVLKALKAYPQSVEMLERAVSLNPKDSEAMHQLAAVQALQLVHGGIQASAVS